MVKKILSLINKQYGGINEAAILLGVFSLTSQLLGLIRERALVSQIGPGIDLDIYYAAFKIPDLIFTAVASLVAVTALIPFLTEKISQEPDNKKAVMFMNRVFSAFFSAMMIVLGIAYLAMPSLVHFVAPGFSTKALHELSLMSRIMLISPLLLGLQNLLGSVAQTYRKFFVFALAPVLYNVGILIGIFFFYSRYGIYGLAYGVVIGAFLHFLIQVPTVLHLGFNPRFTTKLDFKELGEIVRIALPRTLTLAMNTITVTILISLASKISAGSISILNFAINLQTFPIMMISLSYAIAAFPTLVEAFSLGNIEKFKNIVVETARQIIFWSLPITTLFIVLRAHIVRVVYGTNTLSWNDTRLTAGLFALLSFAIIASSLVLIFVRAYYASGRTKVPFFVTVSGMCITLTTAYFSGIVLTTNIELSESIAHLFRLTNVSGIKILSLGIGYCVGQFFNLTVFWLLFRKHFGVGVLRPVHSTLFKGILSSILGGLVTYFVLIFLAPYVNQDTFLGILGQGFLAGVLGILVILMVLRILKSKELSDFTQALHHKFWKSTVIAPGAEGLD